MASSTSFADKVVWITGASAGLGQEMAREFARRGASLALSARRGDRIQALAEELRKAGGRAIAVPCDVTDDAAVAAAVASVVAEYGRLDVAVANAGFGVAGKVAAQTAEDWRRQFDTNVIGVISTVRHALPHLKQTKGRIALVGSVAALVTSPGNAAYSASKAAVRTLGQALSMELAKSGVTCTTLHPGFVHSEIGQVDNDGVHHPEREDPRPKALLWPTDRAARVMVDAIERRKRDYVFTAHGKLGAFLGQHFPGLVTTLVSRFG